MHHSIMRLSTIILVENYVTSIAVYFYILHNIFPVFRVNVQLLVFASAGLAALNEVPTTAAVPAIEVNSFI